MGGGEPPAPSALAFPSRLCVCMGVCVCVCLCVCVCVGVYLECVSMWSVYLCGVCVYVESVWKEERRGSFHTTAYEVIAFQGTTTHHWPSSATNKHLSRL